MILEITVIFIIGELLEAVVAREEACGDEGFGIEWRKPWLKLEEWPWSWRDAVVVEMVKLEGFGTCYEERCCRFWIMHCCCCCCCKEWGWGIAVLLWLPLLCFRQWKKRRQNHECRNKNQGYVGLVLLL